MKAKTPEIKGKTKSGTTIVLMKLEHLYCGVKWNVADCVHRQGKIQGRRPVASIPLLPGSALPESSLCCRSKLICFARMGARSHHVVCQKPVWEVRVVDWGSFSLALSTEKLQKSNWEVNVVQASWTGKFTSVEGIESSCTVLQSFLYQKCI